MASQPGNFFLHHIILNSAYQAMSNFPPQQPVKLWLQNELQGSSKSSYCFSLKNLLELPALSFHAFYNNYEAVKHNTESIQSFLGMQYIKIGYLLKS